MAVKTWGKFWCGKTVQIFCDNDSVCDVIHYLKPKNPDMQIYLREFLFWVCKYNFHPLVSKIASKENDIADFLSRTYLQGDIDLFFARENLPPQNRLTFSETDFTLIADW